MNKPYKLGIIVGRFQVLHKGHCKVIESAMAICEKVAVFIGSSQEEGTKYNPFSYDFRKEMLSAIYPEVDIHPLPDAGLGNNLLWGDYVLDKVNKECGQNPDIFITGTEGRRQEWFGDNVAQLLVPKVIDVSATELRSLILNDKHDEWKTLVEPSLYPYYDEMRKIIIESDDKEETESI